MKLLPALALFALAGFAGKALAPSNSAVETKKGKASFEKREARDAVDHLAAADSAAPSPRTKFNVGTAEAVAGDAESAERDLEAAMADPELRSRAWYNIGNARLAQKEFDAAVRAYANSLRIDPSAADAKRNLEIALRRHEEERRRQRGEGEDESGGGESQQPDGEPSDDGGEPSEESAPEGETDADALLRAIEEQEREELSRMRRSREQRRRIDW
jgi:Ca-activated chloride channel homolog